MKLAFLFPGQGSQRVGMGSDLYANEPAARGIFDRADAVLGFPLSRLCFEGPEEELRPTLNAQPALFTAGAAALEAFRSRVTVEPFAVAGHSLGEYTALYAAGAIDFERGLRLVRRRAEVMHEAAEKHPGTMAAVIGLESEAVKEAVAGARDSGVVAVANYNSPGQVVISGEAAAVERAGELAKAAGARRIIPLAVSGGFHSPLMASAGDAFYPDLRAALFKEAKPPVVVNVAAEYVHNGVDFAPYLTMQLSGAVRWEESMRRLLADGVDTFIEFGAGDVLCGLLKRIDRSAACIAVHDSPTLAAAVSLAQSGTSNS